MFGFKSKETKTQEQREVRLSKIQSNISDLVQNGVNQFGQSAIALRLSDAGLSGGYHAADCLHNIYSNFGYPQTLQFYNFWNMFRRNGTAKAIINIPPNITWLDDPTIEASDQFR